MNEHVIYQSQHWIITHRTDSRYPGYLIISSCESTSDLSKLGSDSLQELGLVLKIASELLTITYKPCKVIFYKLGFSSGYSCHFHVAAVTETLLSEIASHPHYSDDPDGNDVIMFLSRIYCEKVLSAKEQSELHATVKLLRTKAIGLKVIK